MPLLTPVSSPTSNYSIKNGRARCQLLYMIQFHQLSSAWHQVHSHSFQSCSIDRHLRAMVLHEWRLAYTDDRSTTQSENTHRRFKLLLGLALLSFVVLHKWRFAYTDNRAIEQSGKGDCICRNIVVRGLVQKYK
jgi:hypothetical protein